MGKAIQPLYALAAGVTIVVATLLAAAITGNFRVDNSNHPAVFGVYDNAVAQAARLNTLWETIAIVECITLLLLPIALLIARRYFALLRDITVLPWITGVAGVACAVFLWPLRFGWDTRPFDPFTMSELSTLYRIKSPCNRSDTLRDVDPLREPHHAYHLDLLAYHQPNSDVPYKTTVDILHGGGMVTVDTSYTCSIQQMTGPVTELSMFGFMLRGSLSHQEVGIEVVARSELAHTNP